MALKDISTNFGLNPLFITAFISDGHVNGGTIISPPFGYLLFRYAKVIKFADDPELI